LSLKCIGCDAKPVGSNFVGALLVIVKLTLSYPSCVNKLSLREIYYYKHWDTGDVNVLRILYYVISSNIIYN